MTDKPEYYAVLGLTKGATEEEIKKAHQKKVMKYHPDRNVNKSAEEKAEAQKNFQQVAEAFDILGDAQKRATYDSYGHDGLARLASGNTTQTGRSYTDLAGPVAPPKPVSVDDAFSFFDRRKSPGDAQATPVVDTTAGDDLLSAEEAREARRRAREARRGQTGSPFDVTIVTPPRPVPAPAPKPAETRVVTPPPAPAPAPKTTAGSAFDAARQESARVKDSLERAERLGADIPVEALEAFRDNLQDMLKVVNTAIARARKGGPKL